MTTFGSRYLAAIERISAAVCSIDPATPIPACPGWTVQDLVAHLTGLAEDWTLGRLDGYAGDAWTMAQVERHRSRPLAELLTALHEGATAVTRLEPHAVLGEPARWAFGDALIHEADIGEAIGAAKPPHDDVLTHLGAGLKRWSAQLAAAGVQLEVGTSERRWTIGAEVEGGVQLRVVGAAYDIWRAVYGRRTWTQFCALPWNRTPTELAKTGLPYPFGFAV